MADLDTVVAAKECLAGWKTYGKQPSEDECSKALDLLKSDYWNDVRGVAADIVERVISGDLEPDDVSDAVHETVDGHQSVIYTWRAQLVLVVSEKSDAGPEEMGGLESFTSDGGVNWSALAYWAMRADVDELLGMFDLEAIAADRAEGST